VRASARSPLRSTTRPLVLCALRAACPISIALFTSTPGSALGTLMAPVSGLITEPVKPLSLVWKIFFRSCLAANDGIGGRVSLSLRDGRAFKNEVLYPGGDGVTVACTMYLAYAAQAGFA